MYFYYSQRVEVRWHDIFNSASGFTHLDLYEVSYIWYSAVACMFCLVVGTAVSLVTKPQDPKFLNPELISPAFTKLVDCWPKCMRPKLDIGSKFVRFTLVRLFIKCFTLFLHQ